MKDIWTIRAPDDPVVYDEVGARWWAERELREAVGQRAAELSGTRRLAFCFCRNDVASLVNYLGCTTARHPVALLDASLPPAQRDALLALYRPEIVLDGSRADVAPPAPGRQLAADLTLLLPTSGSTGSPKLVRLSQRNVVANAESIRTALGIAASDRAMLALPLHYSFGLSVVHSHLLAGATIVMTQHAVMQAEFWHLFAQESCTSLAGVPLTYQMLRRLGLEKVAPPSLKTLSQAGGRLAPELIAEFSEIMRRRSGKFFVMYGQTEATARMTILPSECLPAKLGSVGPAIPGGALRVEKNGTLQPALAQGEVIYNGPNVMMGYADGPQDLSLGDVTGGSLRTGDIGFLDTDGFLTITGRSKRFAKVFGYRINLDDVEHMLRDVGSVAAVDLDDKIVVFLESADADLGVIKKRLATELRVHHGAFTVHRLERLPRTPAGKIDYPQLAIAP